VFVLREEFEAIESSERVTRLLPRLSEEKRMVSGHGGHRAPVLKSREHEPCFAPFDIAVRKRSRSWEWTVFASTGKPVMLGREYSREAANYQSIRALFVLLSAHGARARRCCNPHYDNCSCASR
jgi:hypothetical protein